MRRFLPALIALLLLLMSAASAQTPATASTSQSPAAAADDGAQLRLELEQMKKSVGDLEDRLAAQEKLAQAKKDEATQPPAIRQPQPNWRRQSKNWTIVP
jgi:Skp family chaperone for outer membrane proteins